ncbi:MAG TPA: hypothetical protein VMG82_01075 [Candidatus Sulfotelmatobacter sp.]|nr:hypothetical protein [Candidatus Sulfotelmatobacter sp.]
MMGQLASALAHEISQPLGAILRNAEAAELFLQDASPDLEEIRAILADIRKDDSAGNAIDRIRGLFKWQSLDRRPVEMGELVGEVVALVRSDAAGGTYNWNWPWQTICLPCLGTSCICSRYCQI